MFRIKLFTYIKGFVRIKVTGRFVERFLNICTNRNIYIWNIKNRGNELLHMDMSIDGFKQLPPITFKTKTKAKIISRHGLPFIFARHKKRKVFFIAGIITAAIFMYITSYVWVIDVEGNNKVSRERIISALEANDFKVGSLRYGNDILSLQNKMLLEVDELSWIWVDIKGTRAVVQVKEKTPIPQIVDKRIPCNIVAGADGLITSVEATYGEKIINVGDVVKKGDLLISGITNTKYGGIHYLHSSGKIKARIWHSKSADFPLKKIKFSKTGKIFSKKTINFFGFRVKLYSKENLPYKYSEESVKKHHLSLGENMVFPIAYENRIYNELLRYEEVYTPEETAELAAAELGQQLEAQLPANTSVVNKSFEFVPVEDGIINVKVNYECIEEIGVEIPVEIQ